jgi:t-SNARE complex subunit (syntaxin)
MIEATHPDLVPHLHRVEDEVRTGTEIVRAIDRQAIVQAEAVAEALEKNDQDVTSHHQTRKSCWKDYLRI